MTGKGDRWGRDSEGRSAPAFLAASTTALPPLTCTIRQEAGRRHRQLLFRCEAGHLLAVYFEACAGRRIRWLCPPAVACSAGCVLPAVHFCLPCPLPSSVLAPIKFACPIPFLLCLHPVHFHVRQDHRRLGPAVCQGQQFASYKTVPLAAATRACSGGPCTGPLADSPFLFLFAESI